MALCYGFWNIRSRPAVCWAYEVSALAAPSVKSAFFMPKVDYMRSYLDKCWSWLLFKF